MIEEQKREEGKFLSLPVKQDADDTDITVWGYEPGDG